MITISKKFWFDAAHQLTKEGWDFSTNEKIFGKCARLHGHTYCLEVAVTGAVHKNNGMVMNYFDLSNVVKPIVDGVLDHKFLNDVFPQMLTTAENMVIKIGEYVTEEMKRRFPDIDLAYITLQETQTTKATWTP